jgi:Tol biopolymer transport system component
MRATVFVTLALIATARGQSTTLVSVRSDGVQGNSQSNYPCFSFDGRYVAFHSFADNLVLGGSYGGLDVFVHDRALGTTERVSVDSAGNAANSDANLQGFSWDGRYVVLWSLASNLVASDFNGVRDTFVHDRITGVMARVSVDSNGSEANGASEYGSSITADGRFVAFSSYATNLVAGDTNGALDVFVHDRSTGLTTRESVDGAGGQANGASAAPMISADGRFLAFGSNASNLIAGDSNGKWDVFERDRTTGAVARVSVHSNGTQSNDSSFGSSISADGRFVAFSSYASTLANGDTNTWTDVFVHDLWTGTTTRVSVDPSGNHAFGQSAFASLSADGRWIAFVSDTPTAGVGSGTSGHYDVFVQDRSTGVHSRVNVSSLGERAGPGAFGLGSSSYPSVSPDGRYIAFASSSINLAPADSNNTIDVFVRGPEPFPPTPYCVGHREAGADCPCDNGAVGHGCPNSTFPSGALLTATGSTRVTADSLTLSASSMSGSYCLFVQGNGHADEALGAGKNCLAGSLVRVGSYVAVGGTASNPSGTEPPISVKGQVPPSGATRYYQAVYRNTDPSFCFGEPFNRTNGVAVVWYP